MGIIWLNVCMAVGMALCVFTGALKVSLTVCGYSLCFPAANLIFAFLTFPATDILAEVYGKKVANQTVWIGYASQALTTAVIHLMLLLPGDTSVLAPFGGASFRVFAASSVAYLAAQFWDVYIFHWIRDRVTG
ncbi:MAG: queuosine precursor transporter, partial [Chlamydiia bacterium]|nr:queuosine precursor transporter [Chlamydiia bacterium]